MIRGFLILLLLVVIAANFIFGVNLGEYAADALHYWQTGETREERIEREKRHAVLEKELDGVEACIALRDFASVVDREPVNLRGMRAQLLLENVRENPNREFVSDYLDVFHLAYREGREFDQELRRIVKKHCP